MTEIADADVINQDNLKTAIVILNWNTKDFLRMFLPPLLHSIENVEGAEVIVADNASTDGSLTVMKEEFPSVRTLSFEKNLGFTGGYNKAFEQIDSDLFVLINSDIEVSEGWLQPLIRWMQSHPECSACAPKLHSWQERGRFEYAGAAGGYIDRYGYPFCRGRVLKYLEDDHGQYDTPADVFWATGACLMVRSKVFRELGGLDERFFAHMEEIDLCWRMQLAGYKVTVVPESVVYHVGGGTLPASSPFKLYLNYRNSIMMLENNLAMTFALAFHNKGIEPVKATKRGSRKARNRIRCRKALDLMSAAVYLLTFKPKCFKAVLRAHADARKMTRRPSGKDIQSFFNGSSTGITGIYRKWMIPSAIFKKDSFFQSLRENDFYTI